MRSLAKQFQRDENCSYNNEVVVDVSNGLKLCFETTSWRQRVPWGLGILLSFSIFNVSCTEVEPEFEDIGTRQLKVEQLQSPSNNTTPTIRLSNLGLDMTVSIYTSADCSSAAIGVGTGDESGQVEFEVSPLAVDDTYHFHWAFNDTCSTEYIEYELDRTSPEIGGLADDLVATTSKTLIWSCNETCNYKYLIDQIALSTPTGSYVNATTATQSSGSGTYYIHVQAQDLAGNLSSVEHVQFEMDNTAPADPSGLSLTPTLISPGNDSSPSIRVSGVVSGDDVEIFSDSDCTTSMGSTTAAGATVDIVSSVLATDGTYNYWAKTTDPLNNESNCSTATVGYQLDRQIPAVLGLANDGTPTKIKNWNWTCDELNCDFKFSVDTVNTNLPAGVYGGISVATQSTGTNIYWLHVQAIDPAGNESNPIHVSAVLDNTPPSPPGLFHSSPLFSYGTDSTPTFNAAALTVGDTVELFRSSCGGVAEDSVVATGASQLLTSAVIPTEGLDWFYAWAKDSLGNASTCSALFYTYDNSAPTSPPSLISVALATGNNLLSPQVTFTSGSDPHSSENDEARVMESPGLVPVSNWDTFFSTEDQVFVNLGPLVSGQDYVIEMRTRNIVGLYSSLSYSNIFLYDNTAPTDPVGPIGLGSVPNPLNRTPTLSFGAASDSESGISHYEVEIRKQADNSLVSAWTELEDGIGSEHEFFDGIMDNGGSYYARVRSVNTVGLISSGWIQSPNWSVGCATTTLLTQPSTAYSNAYGHYCFEVPALVNSISVKAWGGGGGGSVSHGGGGGYVTGQVAVTPGELLFVTVGDGGEGGNTSSGGDPGYGGGGMGDEKFDAEYNWGGGGGGYTGLFRGTNPLLMAGGGGGGQGDFIITNQAGAGGGTNGLNDSDLDGGKGGTQFAGGSGAEYFDIVAVICGENGSYLKGGNAAVDIRGTFWGGGGGGGGGYYGGGGGCTGGSSKSTSGGGGSSFYGHGDVSFGSTTAGSLTIPANEVDADRDSYAGPSNVGFGGVLIQDGGHGRIYITW